MCEHCRSGKMWKEDKEEDVCEWSNPEPLEDEDELPPMCPNPATRVVWDRHVEDHLCDEHVDQENVDLEWSGRPLPVFWPSAIGRLFANTGLPVPLQRLSR